MPLEWITALLGAGGGAVLSALIAGLFLRHKVQAEAVQILTQASGSIVERLDSEVQRLSEENRRIREERIKDSKRISCLERKDRKRTERLVDHIVHLHAHINDKKGPPPPDVPDVDVEWPTGFVVSGS